MSILYGMTEKQLGEGLNDAEAPLYTSRLGLKTPVTLRFNTESPKRVELVLVGVSHINWTCVIGIKQWIRKPR